MRSPVEPPTYVAEEDEPEYVKTAKRLTRKYVLKYYTLCEDSDLDLDFQMIVEWYAQVCGDWRVMIDASSLDGHHYEVKFDAQTQSVDIEIFKKIGGKLILLEG